MKAIEVALLAEGVDRNDKAPTRLEVFGAVALLAEGRSEEHTSELQSPQ